jgi:hypothetical protein
MNVRILPLAMEDLEGGRVFYNLQEDDLGEEFVRLLFSDMESLERYGGIHSRLYGFHRLIATRFPFAIYYRIIAGEVVIHRVLDCRQDPRWIRKALGRE